MRAKDIMTTDVATISPEMAVAEIAQLLMDNKISGAPVIDAAGKAVGMVSEGDLLQQVGLSGGAKRSWWLRLVSTPEQDARDFVKSHGRTAGDIMTTDVVSITEDTSTAEIARLLEERRIKRVPVLRDGALVGIVSRGNLLHALAGHRDDGPAEPTADDRTVRQAVSQALQSKGWASHGATNVIVTDGVVELWGWVETEVERKAMLVATQEVPGVQKVIDHLGAMPAGT
ncbi:MAG: CBS domain-containing protein [Rhodospirillaceae bacterium]|nr:CBS domain-containing protein [Rhodospirillaceae bacterium]MBT4690807.1 CBS domain-containing protein [Rhodospirillaceae bacterium]